MIDENLCRAELTPSDRARFTKRRKEAYEALHPETVNGRNQHTESRDGQVVHPSFAEDQARATGVDARTVRRDVERGSKVIEEVLDLIRGTSLDTGRSIISPVSMALRRASMSEMRLRPSCRSAEFTGRTEGHTAELQGDECFLGITKQFSEAG